jgi:hypothetical protein
MGIALLVATFFASALSAQSESGRARIALFEPAGQKNDAALTAALSAVANSVELSLDLLQRYEVTRTPSANPETDLDQVRAYCRKNHFDQAILGSGNARPEGGYHFRLMVYDRKKDKVTTDQKGDSKGALDMFDTTDTLVASLLDGLSGTHLLFGSLSVDSDPAGATISVNGKDVGQAPLSLRGLPAGTVELTGRMVGREPAKTTVTISDGETTNASLTLPLSMGVLTVAMPKDAVMSVVSVGVELKRITGPGTAMLPAGDYEVQASCPGLPGVSGKVTITSGVSTQWQPWAKGYLDVRSDPAGATIVVDGVERGPTPLVIELEPGVVHRVELKMEHYETYNADLSQDAGSKTLFSPALTAVQSGGVAGSPVVSIKENVWSIEPRGSVQLVATVTPSSSNQPVTWSSANSSIAKVSSTGVVTGVAAGTTVITATVSAGRSSATCFIAVWQLDGTGYLRYYSNDSASLNRVFWRLRSQSNRVLASNPILATVEKVSGARNMGYGIVFCAQDSSNYYRLLIASNGYYEVAKSVAGTISILSPWAPSTAIKAGQGLRVANILGVSQPTTGNIAITINSTPVTTISDSSFTGGKVGFWACNGTHENFPTIPEDIRYKVTRPVSYP